MARGKYEKETNNDTLCKIIIITLVSLLITTIITSLFFVNWYIEIDGSNVPSIVEYNEELPMPIARVKGRLFLKNGFKVTVSADKLSDTSTIGQHVNQYSANWLFYKTSHNHSVLVVDSKQPEITLAYKDNYYTPPGSEYIEEGYTAYDEYDGDLTDKVQVFQNGDIITYLVQDSSGNIQSVERTINRGDIEPPTMQLNGPLELTIGVGTSYNDAGVVVTDNADGDISKQVVIDGRVDTDNPGTYELKYIATDKSNNTVTATRIVHVVEIDGDVVERTGYGKTIYLTFDDGPSKYTPELLNTLKKYEIKATFFVVGNNGHLHLIEDITNDGHSIGIHSATHSYKTIYENEEVFLKDLYKMQEIIEEYSGVKTYLMRFPGGSSNTISKSYCEGIMTLLTKKVEELGFRYFDWNVISGDDGGTTNSEQIFKNVTNGIKNTKNAIVLQHDTKDFSVAAVEDIIKWGLENGYAFAPLNMESPTAHHTVAN